MIRTTLTQGIWSALFNTIIYTIGAFAFGMVAGTVLALMRLSSVGPYRWIASAYIEFFRGLPAIVVFLVFALLPLAIPGLRIPLEPYGKVWLALGIVASAYLAETIRGRIRQSRGTGRGGPVARDVGESAMRRWFSPRRSGLCCRP